MIDMRVASAGDDAVSVFRRSLARRLASRGYPPERIPAKVDELLRTGAKLRLNVEDILEGRHES